jgi:hypothetical protein
MLYWRRCATRDCADLLPALRQIKARSCAQRVFLKLHSKGTSHPRDCWSGGSDSKRKIISLLDEEQREAVRVLLDFGTAVFSAGLVVAALKGFVDLVM